MITLYKFINKVRWCIFTPIVRMRFKARKWNVGTGFKANGNPYLKNLGGRIDIGDNVRFNSSRTYNPIGYGTRINIELLPDGKLKIGNHVGVSNASIVCSKEIHIGDYVDLGDGVKIYDTDFHSLNPFIRKSGNDYENTAKKKVVVEDYAFIGAGSLLLKGSHVGRYSVIGAGAIVTGKVPDAEVWAGNPAKFIRKLTEEELEQRFK